MLKCLMGIASFLTMSTLATSALANAKAGATSDFVAPDFVVSDFVVSYRSAVGVINTNYHDYYLDVLKLTLEKTRPQYGSYSLQHAPAVYSKIRALTHTAENVTPNLIIEAGYENEFNTNGSLIHTAIPIDGGIFGYRVCHTHIEIKEKLKNVKTIKDLQGYTIGQGIGWTDTSILRANGLKVVEVENYHGISKMLNAKRLDLFCRGINQIKNEAIAYKDLTNLTQDESFVLVYPAPRFFYLHAKNIVARDRIQAGLKIAFDDGSLKKLWKHHYQSSIEFAKLQNRQFIYLENPHVKNLSIDYKKYFFDPLSKE